MARIAKPRTTDEPLRPDLELPPTHDGGGNGSTPPRPPRTGGGGGGGGGPATPSAGGNPDAPFLVQVRDELRRVTWPDRDHLVQATIVVIIVVLVAAAYLSALDALFSRLIGLVL